MSALRPARGSAEPVAGLVSTVIPVRNRPRLLGEAIASVLAQRHRPIEVIVVDDGSTDDTPAAARALADRHPGVVRVLRQDAAGPGAARELGRRSVRGAFVQYLDSDDLLAPGKFERQVAGLERNPQCDISYGGTRRFTLDEAPSGPFIRATGRRLERAYPALLVGRPWATSTPLYRRRIVDRAGPWQALSCEEDWEHDMRMAALGARLHFANAHVCDVRDHDGPQLHRDELTAHTRLRNVARARTLMLDHALALGAGMHMPEFRHFVRALFLIARQCGAAGLADEARHVLALARRASAADARRGLDIRLYGALSQLLGHRTIGRLSDGLDRLRSLARSRP